MSEFGLIEESLKGDCRKLVLLHSHTDVDAIASAAALKFNFQKICIAAPENVSRHGKALTEAIGVEIEPVPSLESFDMIVVLDTASPDMLGEQMPTLMDFRGKVIVIDHHLRNPDWERFKCVYYADETKRSCAEIVYQLMRSAGLKIDRRTGNVLIAGIVTDTSHFRHCGSETLRTVAEIAEISGASVDESIHFLITEGGEWSHSRRIAQLKGAQRLRFVRVKDYIIAGTNVGAFEAAVSNSLLLIGADISFVCSGHENDVRMSGRAVEKVVKEGFHMGRFLSDVGNETGCVGGGHAGAGGLHGRGDPEAMVNICLRKAEDWVLRNTA